MMSMFNFDQREHMKWLVKQPRENICQCGWYRKDECPNTHCCDDARRIAANQSITRQAGDADVRFLNERK